VQAPESGGRARPKANPVAYADEKSDTFVVPKKPVEQGDDLQMVEGRNAAKGNVSENPTPDTEVGPRSHRWDLRARTYSSDEGQRVAFYGTATPHHTNATGRASMRYADAAAGVDAVTWDYEEGLSTRVHALHREIPHRELPATPSRQVYIPKADGKDRWA
jgi:hypothetical protein